MRLPRADRAIIESAKLRGYLLSVEHPVGRFKAAFFRRLGYTSSEWRRLEEDLRELALQGETRVGRRSRHGRKYEVRGILAGPSGRQAGIVTV